MSIQINPNDRAEDVRWLAETGESLIGAARRLGISREALEKWLTTHQMRDELEALRRRDPADLTLMDRALAGGRARWAS